MKKIFTTFLILITMNVFSQEVNFRRVQNSMIIDTETNDTLSKHSSDAEAQQELINHQLKGRSVKMIGSVYEVDIEIEETTSDPYEKNWDQIMVIDTVQILAFNYGNVRSKNRAVLNYYYDILITSKDSSQVIPHYTFTSRLEQTKSWPDAQTKYKLTDILFQFYQSDSIWNGSASTEMRSRTFGSSKHCIRHYINGNEVKGSAKFESISCNPGNSTYAGGSFRHTNTFRDLDRSKDNLIKVEALDIDTGNVIGSREFVIKKL